MYTFYLILKISHIPYEMDILNHTLGEKMILDKTYS
jgi:hypothetical protein